MLRRACVALLAGALLARSERLYTVYQNVTSKMYTVGWVDASTGQLQPKMPLADWHGSQEGSCAAHSPIAFWFSDCASNVYYSMLASNSSLNVYSVDSLAPLAFPTIVQIAYDRVTNRLYSGIVEGGKPPRDGDEEASAYVPLGRAGAAPTLYVARLGMMGGGHAEPVCEIPLPGWTSLRRFAAAFDTENQQFNFAGVINGTEIIAYVDVWACKLSVRGPLPPDYTLSFLRYVTAANMLYAAANMPKYGEADLLGWWVDHWERMLPLPDVLAPPGAGDVNDGNTIGYFLLHSPDPKGTKLATMDLYEGYIMDVDLYHPIVSVEVN